MIQDSSSTTPAALWTWYNPLSWLRPLYIWTLSWASQPGATRALAFFSAIESFIFPIPVDPLLMAMGTARPQRAIYFAVVCSLASVFGALIGYFLGLTLWNLTSDFFLTYVISPENFQAVIYQFNEHTFLAIFLAAFTPIPFKVFTLAGGVAGVNLLSFIFGALLGRSARFLLIGALMYFFGAPIRSFLDKYLEKISIACAVLIVIVVILL